MIETDIALVCDAETLLDEYEHEETGETIPAPLGVIPYVKGRTAILGAETGVGKTAFGQQSWVMAIEADEPSLYLNLEMTPRDFAERLAPQLGGEEAMKSWLLKHREKVFVSRPYIDADEIEKLIRTEQFGFVVLDHIHELPFDGHEDLGRKVKRIASLASACDTAILMLSQMKQRDEYSVGPPTKKDFSWTKAISEVAAQLYAIWLPDEDDQWTAELVNLKNRFGPRVSEQPLKFNPHKVTFEKLY